LVFGGNIREKLGSVGSFFASKNSLYLENQVLKLQLRQNDAMMANYNSVLAENVSLKEILGRKDETRPNDRSVGREVNLVLSAILSKPNQSPFDILVIDTGAKDGLQIGDTVFALGNVPIGRIANVYPHSSKVILFSNAGERTQAVFSSKPARTDARLNDSFGQDSGHSGGNIFTEVVGRGGGNFEMIVPRDLTLLKGDQVVLPGIAPYLLGIVETIISDPRDPFVKALLVSPVNIQELKLVEVETHK